MGAFVTALTKELPSKLLVTMVVAAYVVSVVVPHFVTKSMEPCVRTLQLYRFPSLAVLAIDLFPNKHIFFLFFTPAVLANVAIFFYHSVTRDQISYFVFSNSTTNRSLCFRKSNFCR